MTASRSEPQRLAMSLVALSVLAAGCQAPGWVSEHEILDPMVRPAALPPDAVDIAAARLMKGIWADDRAVIERAVVDVERGEAERAAKRESKIRYLASLERRTVGPRRKRKVPRRTDPYPRPVPLALDARNASLGDAREYRLAASELLRRHDLDPALRERLARAVADDPLALAAARSLDAMQAEFAYNFNSISEPLGRTLMTGILMAPLQIATTAAHWLAGFFERAGMSVQSRQALELRKQFLRLHPNADEADSVAKKIERGEHQRQAQLASEEREAAREAFGRGRLRYAAHLASSSLLREPDNRSAQNLLARARADIEGIDRAEAASLRATNDALDDLEVDAEASREVMVALLNSDPELGRKLRELSGIDRDGRLDDEIEFVRALVHYETGEETRSFERLAAVERRDPQESNMSRHAWNVRRDPHQDPHAAFERRLSEGRKARVRYEVLGSFANGPRYKQIPAALAYLVDAPALAQTIALAPVRLIFASGRPKPDFQGPTALAAYDYVSRHPQGEHTTDMLRWLVEYEQSRKNYPAALRIADFLPGFPEEQRTELAERSAGVKLLMANRLERRDQRGSLLRAIVREFPDSTAGRVAGHVARYDVENASAQRIRMTRGYLMENPDVAGHRGLGLRRSLLDGRIDNGEIHENGVSFLGGRWIEISLVDGDEESDPEIVEKQVSVERISRTVGVLDEASRRNARVDRDETIDADAERDLFFERARLGLIEEPDMRPAAESTYVFEGMRERYGMVRGREGFLPFDLVVKGSLADMSMGAFPRWKPPRETPDAFLYK